KTLRIWNVANRERVRSYPRYPGPVSSCAFSPDGRLAVSAAWDYGGWDPMFHPLDGARGELGRTFPGAHHRLGRVRGLTLNSNRRFAHQVRSCAFSPDGRFILAASQDQTLHLWEVMSGKLARTFRSNSSRTYYAMDKEGGCAFSPDGRFALAASKSFW